MTVQRASFTRTDGGCSQVRCERPAAVAGFVRARGDITSGGRGRSSQAWAYKQDRISNLGYEPADGAALVEQADDGGSEYLGDQVAHGCKHLRPDRVIRGP